MDELTPLEKYDRDLQEHMGGKSDFRAHAAGIAAVLPTVIACTLLTYFSHFTFGFLKIVFGVFTGILVKHFGKGSGTKYGVLAGLYAVAAVVAYEMILETLFIAADNPANSTFRYRDEEQQAFQAMAYSFVNFIRDTASAAGAFVLAYRIGKNPMKKDELDYLLEAKHGDAAEAEVKYAGNYFKKKRRR